MRMEGLGKLKNQVTSSGIEPATFMVQYNLSDAIRFAVSSIVNGERGSSSPSARLFVLPSIAAVCARIAYFDHMTISCKSSANCTPVCSQCLNSDVC
jgi:hypothetical protein